MSEEVHPHFRIMRGIVLRVAAIVVFSMMAALVKLAATWGAHLGEIILLRCLLGVFVVVAWVVPREGWTGLAPQRPRALMARNTLGVIAMLASFEALVILPLAEAITIGFTAPIFATLLSWLILRERVGAHRWAAAMVAFTGVLIVMRPGSGTETVAPLGVLLALGGAFFGGSVTIALRHMAGIEGVGAIVFWFQATAGLVGAVLIAFIGYGAGSAAFLVLLLAGLFGGLGQIFMTASLHAAPVGVLAPFDYLQLILAALLGWLLIGTTPTVYTWAGAVLITGSGLYTVWREHRLNRGVEEVATPPTL